LNKKDVGKRLALGAMKFAYNEDIVFSGPIYESSEIKNNQISLSFDAVGSGLVSIDGEPLSRFEIAGDDQHFVWAKAKIEGDKVIVENGNINNPKYVRYAWSDNPQGSNLYNKEGLPASPFRNYNPDSLNNKPWQGKKATVVLTYDDALNVHLDNVQPALDALNIKGTFYVSTYSEAFRNRIDDWRRLAHGGHELGNHTIFHPCVGKDSRPWVNPNYDMGAYTVERMVDEIKFNNTLLEAVDGKKERTFAYTCGDFTVNGNDFFIDKLKGDLVGARAVRHEMHKIEDIDIYSIDSYAIIGETGEQMIELVKKAIETNSLLVFLFHGVGGEHSMDVSLSAHQELIEYLKSHETEVWTTTMLEAVENIRKNQSN
jgi:sialate O-acetylesterase